MSDAPTTTKQRNGGRLLGIAFLVLFATVCITAIAGYFGFRSKPDYWNEQRERIAQMSDEQRIATSEKLMNRLLDQWSEAPANATTADDLIGQRTSIHIPYQELNVWLDQEGIGLLTDIGVQMPKSVKGAMVDSAGEGLLRVSCEIKTEKIEQVVSVTFDIKVADDGEVISKLVRARAGLLPIPKDKAIDLIAKRANESESGGRMLALLTGTPIKAIDIPIDPSEDGLRDGRLVGLEVLKDAMVITRETVRRKKDKTVGSGAE